MIIDAKDLIAGRIGTFVAKQALLGETIDIINAEKAVVSGKKYMVFDHYIKKAARGIPSKGPFITRMPDRFLKRIIRDMLPYKQPKGRSAYERIKCHVGIPESLKGKETTAVTGADMNKLPTPDKVTILDICRQLGAQE